MQFLSLAVTAALLWPVVMPTDVAESAVPPPAADLFITSNVITSTVVGSTSVSTVNVTVIALISVETVAVTRSSGGEGEADVEEVSIGALDAGQAANFTTLVRVSQQGDWVRWTATGTSDGVPFTRQTGLTAVDESLRLTRQLSEEMMEAMNPDSQVSALVSGSTRNLPIMLVKGYDPTGLDAGDNAMATWNGEERMIPALIRYDWPNDDSFYVVWGFYECDVEATLYIDQFGKTADTHAHGNAGSNQPDNHEGGPAIRRVPTTEKPR